MWTTHDVMNKTVGYEQRVILISFLLCVDIITTKYFHCLTSNTSTSASKKKYFMRYRNCLFKKCLKTDFSRFLNEITETYFKFENF